MAHPYNELRETKVERRRVPHITKGYASGGAVHSDSDMDRVQIKRMVKKTALKLAGGPVTARADRPGRAKGGGVVNVIIQPSEQKPAMPPPMPPMAKPPMAPPPLPPSGGGGMAPPGGGMLPPPPPGVLPRAAGGRANADTAGAGQGRTPVQHTNNKQDGLNVGRGPVITKAKGGGMAPTSGTGAGGGLSRLDKAHNPGKYRV